MDTLMRVCERRSWRAWRESCFVASLARDLGRRLAKGKPGRKPTAADDQVIEPICVWCPEISLGNICRSPLAEAALAAEAARAGLVADADSAGTGNWHAGEPPDVRAQRTALGHGVDISGHRGRQVEAADFRTFTHILALDRSNLADLRRRAPADATARLGLLLDHVPGRAGEDVADPYFGDEAGFETTWNDVAAAAVALVAMLGTDT